MTLGRMEVLIFVVGASLLSVNEAVVSHSNTNSNTDHQAVSISEKYGADFVFSRAEAETRTMSVSHAVRVLQTMNQTSSELLKVIQDNLQGHKDAKTSAAPDVQASYSGVMKAELRLNDMMYATHVKLDTVLLECKQFSRFQHFRILELEADSQYYSQQVTSGDGNVLNCREQKTSWGDKIPIVEQELKQHNEDCVAELAELRQQKRIAISDSEVMDSILNMTQCADAAYAKADLKVKSLLQDVSVVSCVNTRTGRKYKKLKTDDPELKQQLSKLKHSKTLDLIKSAFVVDKKAALVQHKTRHLRKAPNSDNYEYETWEEPTVYGEVVVNASVDPNMDAGAEKCAPDDPEKKAEYLTGLTVGDMCPELRERFVNIAGGIEDAIEELTVMISNKQTKCQLIRKELEAEIEHYGYWYKVWETRLANAIASLGESRTQFKNKYSELDDAKGLYSTRMSACLNDADETSNEMCALRTIRNELVRMSYWDTVENAVFDCVVAPEEVPAEGREIREDHWAKNWDEGQCSKTCGKGTQLLSRIVVQYQGPETVSTGADEGKDTAIWQKGMRCPPLRESQTCNEQRCPVDCELDDWEEWSRCTVTCGGGIRERLRPISVHPTTNGNSCPVTLESEECNPAACDVDCQLHPWTEWSVDAAGNPTCTKICGGGQRTRIRELKAPARGHGRCPGFYDVERFQVKQCNTQPCRYHETVSTCIARVDVMLIIDGSGSLGRQGFEQIRQISTRLGSAIKGQGRLGAILYSGTVYSCGRLICVGLGNVLPYRCRYWKGQPMTPLQCGIRWVSPLVDDTEKVVDQMKAMSWPAQNTLTSVAIKSAQIEMINGRKGVPTVAIVITDGYPYSKLHTFKSSQEFINGGGRLMMIPVGFEGTDKADFENYVSKPVDDNLILDETFESLTETNKTLNRILTNFCVQFDEIALAPSDTTIYR